MGFASTQVPLRIWLSAISDGGLVAALSMRNVGSALATEGVGTSAGTRPHWPTSLAEDEVVELARGVLRVGRAVAPFVALRLLLERPAMLGEAERDLMVEALTRSAVVPGSQAVPGLWAQAARGLVARGETPFVARVAFEAIAEVESEAQEDLWRSLVECARAEPAGTWRALSQVLERGPALPERRRPGSQR